MKIATIPKEAELTIDPVESESGARPNSQTARSPLATASRLRASFAQGLGRLF